MGPFSTAMLVYPGVLPGNPKLLLLGDGFSWFFPGCPGHGCTKQLPKTLHAKDAKTQGPVGLVVKRGTLETYKFRANFHVAHAFPG